ncbi:unnamed protein product, partial [Mesorhabditis belari]|uniref:Integrator complex subunit 7 C-terminal domain-containing protein n=1 Tax=Mesorhabditis belari TaxID=2138241 RepID=A0AAF3EL20_9BILA
MWGSLSKMCFAANTRSLDAFHMLGSTASLLNYGLQAIISNEEPASVRIPLLDSTVQTSETHRVNEQSINHLMTVAKSLCMHRLGMPKYLFYQKCQFEVKGPIVPIETVIVTVIVQFAASVGNDYEQLQTVNLKEEDYFNANFLLQFNQNCSVDFIVEFGDSERR